MKIDSPRFGTLTVETGKIIEFPEGLAGFETCRRYSLFHHDNISPKFFILQSLDNPDLAFHVVDPSQLGFSYEIALSDAESDLLKLANPQDAAVVVIVWKDTAEDGSAPLRANLNAPLIINTVERRGLQHIFAQLNYAVADS
ncbi:MAG: flagellar assembly protein FliW [Betaproteobacteria bacterium]|nr:flagellar assembly protein FliW [Betaproteobacteria bacterium]